uniref:PPFIA binding protein 2 n=1 Tax=Tetraodon nigroviridis TaxID=99883 RepID=H3DR96_TETNG
MQVVQLAEDLKLALELQPNQEERESLRAQLPSETTQALINWLQNGEVNLCSPPSNESYQERLLRLEGDKESLVLQVSVLTDQVEAQGEKIRDLESSLEQHRQKLSSTEEMLQQELMSRTSLETQKLDLIDEVSFLKLKLVSMEETHSSSQPMEPADTDQKKAEDLLQEVKQLKQKVEELEGEKGQYERKLRGTKAEISELQRLLASKDAEIECLRSQLLVRGGTADDTTERDQEYQRLKEGMESLLASNEEKDRRIEELTVLLGQCRKIRDVMALTQGGCPKLLGSSEEELSGSLRLRANAHKAHSDILRSEISSRGSSPLMLSSSPYQRELYSRQHHRLMSSSLEDLQSRSSQKASCVNEQTRPTGNRPEQTPLLEMNKYQTLPGKRSEESSNSELDISHHSLTSDSGSPGKQDLYDTGGYRIYSPVCTGVVTLFETGFQTVHDQSPLSSGMDSGQQSPVSPENRKTQRGIKKLWGKIRRSQSGSPAQVHDPELGDFKRGGFRSTAGPRLARPANTRLGRNLKLPFAKWSTEQVCEWLEEIGLGQYVIVARHWVTSGQTLLAATPQDLERELVLKNPLHRKKLQLAIQTITSKQPEKSAELDHIWVTRWLDDIGLPQYKDQFNEGRVDGQMLQYLTVNDLLYLKVTSQLHHLSIKCAIHVLHVNKFHPNCLRRRPGNENQFTPNEVVQWSNHRVMEWLRSVDLAEYAPNLRGSGVHGGLIMLEPRFNLDTLAMLLNIPPQKTLLRRHLTTNFNHLVGAQAQQEKREYTQAAGYSPLSITAKVKPKKLGFSNLTHLRRRRSDQTDYVCPVEASPPQAGMPAANGVQARSHAGFRGLSPILDREADPSRDQVGVSD